MKKVILALSLITMTFSSCTKEILDQIEVAKLKKGNNEPMSSIRIELWTADETDPLDTSKAVFNDYVIQQWNTTYSDKFKSSEDKVDNPMGANDLSINYNDRVLSVNSVPYKADSISLSVKSTSPRHYWFKFKCVNVISNIYILDNYYYEPEYGSTSPSKDVILLPMNGEKDWYWSPNVYSQNNVGRFYIVLR